LERNDGSNLERKRDSYTRAVGHALYRDGATLRADDQAGPILSVRQTRRRACEESDGLSLLRSEQHALGKRVDPPRGRGIRVAGLLDGSKLEPPDRIRDRVAEEAGEGDLGWFVSRVVECERSAACAMIHDHDVRSDQDTLSAEPGREEKRRHRGQQQGSLHSSVSVSVMVFV
jgi:hypothetical protein